MWRQCKAGPTLYQNIVGPGKEYYSFHQKEQMPLSSLKLTKNLEDIELEGFRVAENTAVKDEKRQSRLRWLNAVNFIIWESSMKI